MNKRQIKTSKISPVEVAILALALVVVMVAGVTHAWLRNSYVQTMRDVDQTETRIEEHQDAINSLQVKIDKKLNIYQLRDDLERSGSELVLVPAGSIEKIQANRLTGTVSTSVKDTSIAQITP